MGTLTASPVQLARDLLDAGIVLVLWGDKIRIAGAPTAEQHALITAHRDALYEVLSIEAGLSTRHELLHESHALGYITPALAIPDADVQYVVDAMKAGEDVQKLFRLLSRDRSGNDVAVACVIAAHRLECGRYRTLGGDPFQYEVALDLLVADARRTP